MALWEQGGTGKLIRDPMFPGGGWGSECLTKISNAYITLTNVFNFGQK